MLRPKSVKSWVKKNKVVDVILFGSVVRDKSKPKDIDVCLIIKEEKDSIDIVNSFLEFMKDERLQINIMTERDFISGKNTLVKTLIEEGFSLLRDEKIAESFGFLGKSIFTYSLKGFNSSKRVRFHYALRGRRGMRGVIAETKSELIGDGVLLVPIEKEDKIKEVLDYWEVEYDSRRVLYG